MNRFQRYAIILGFLGALFIASGMVLHNIYAYFPSIGWGGGFLSFLLAGFFATKAKNERKNRMD
jgi:hypothetical protein